MALMLSFPLAQFTLISNTANQSITPSEVEFTVMGISDSNGDTVKATVYLGILVSIVGALSLFTIFAFKNRQLQIRICAMQLVMLFGIVGYMIYYHLRLNGLISELGEYAKHISLTNVTPIIALICLRLAMKAIIKDEILVKSADRIR